ncbi:MAG TPA: lanthionine synthetase LanC family protein [Thermoanaerobaculia bacterium]|nr:lanthionine synthetase LanC family protein [Thermoanaerobaculia bacterium]
MNVTGPFVLRKDILLVPCAELSEDVRSRISFEEGDYTLSHRRGRTHAQVIDGETAALLQLFREPCTIVGAVIENSRVLGKDPRAWLDELLPHFGSFVHRGVLVPAGSGEEEEIRPRFESGATFGEWTIVRCASLVEDTEVYEIRNGNATAALKIARSRVKGLDALFENEATILRHLDGSGIAPRLIDAGVHEERPYIVMEWVVGLEATVAAARLRHDRTSMIELCASIAAAYEALHARGVLHVDVHARNVLVGEKVTLLDFGYSAFIGRRSRVPRAGMYYFYEPELLAAWREDRRIPPSPAGEQYSLAALLYLLITGRSYVDFRFEREEMARQVELDPPLPFAERRVPPWPEVERILFRALEKDPARRHGSIADVTAQLAAVRDGAVRDSRDAPLSAEAHALLENTLRLFARDGAMFASSYPVPTASITFGCAGAAVGLLRIAETRGDPALLALAHVWLSRAAALIGSDGAYYGRGLRRENIGEVTPYHTGSGIQAAAAMVAAAAGDTPSRRRAIAAFLRASDKPCANLDVTLGRSGSLLGAALLLELGEEIAESAAALRAFGSCTMSEIWEQLDAGPPVPDSEPGTYAGMAHGWTGFLYAAMRWCAASGDPLPRRLAERLEEFLALRVAKGRGAYWRTIIGRPAVAIIPAWCNGSAGQVFLFVLAHRLLGDERWLRLAEECAWTTWDAPRTISSLCCGSAGGAYALLNLYKHTGATEWLSRARHLANDAAAAGPPKQRQNTLWRGELGIAVLIADLASPENARMPFFE